MIYAGGRDSNTTKAVNIYDLDTGTWKTTDNALPHPLKLMTSVPYQDSFIIVGGMYTMASVGM